MSAGWEQRWRVEGGIPIRGGQGTSYIAEARDGSGQRVFIKTLMARRLRDIKARRRFAREARIYETLDGLPGLPKLIEHNADTWEHSRGNMYLVLEYIDGQSLRDIVLSSGPVGFDEAHDSIAALGAILAQCHSNDVTHRDIKPANVMIKGSALAEPILVDFGLSFNEDEHHDVTRVGEEVGNRFLRLPEHATGGRSAVSDVAQLVGVLLYLLTGTEPRTLADESGLMPHQRPATRAALEARLQGRPLRRLLAIFDRGFSVRIDDRFPTVESFLEGLEAVTAMETGDDDLEALMAQLDEIATSPAQVNAAELRQKFDALLRMTTTTIDQLAQGKNLTMTQSGYGVRTDAVPPHGETQLSMHAHSEPYHLVVYRFEARGPAEYVLTANGVQLWRGEWIDAELAPAIQKAAIQHFLKNRSE